jgi:hypothetical protein
LIFDLENISNTFCSGKKKMTTVTVITDQGGTCREPVYLYLVRRGDLIPPDDSARFRPTCVDDPVSGKRVCMVVLELHEETHVFYHFVQNNKVIFKIIGSCKPPAERNNRKEVGVITGVPAVVPLVVARSAPPPPPEADIPRTHIAPPRAHGVHRRDPAPPRHDESRAPWDDDAPPRRYRRDDAPPRSDRRDHAPRRPDRRDDDAPRHRDRRY